MQSFLAETLTAVKDMHTALNSVHKKDLFSEIKDHWSTPADRSGFIWYMRDTMLEEGIDEATILTTLNVPRGPDTYDLWSNWIKTTFGMSPVRQDRRRVADKFIAHLIDAFGLGITPLLTQNAIRA